MSENEKLTLGGRFGKIPGDFSLFHLQGGSTLFGGSTFRLLLLASVGSVRGKPFRFRANGTSSSDTTVTSFIFGS